MSLVRKCVSFSSHSPKSHTASCGQEGRTLLPTLCLLRIVRSRLQGSQTTPVGSHRAWTVAGKGHSREPTPTQGSSCLPTPYLGPHSRSHPNSQPLEPPSCLRRQCYLQVRPGQGNHNPLAWHRPGLGPNLCYPSWAERGSGLPGQEKRLPGEGFLPISGCKENLFLGFGDSAWGLPNICLG